MSAFVVLEPTSHAGSALGSLLTRVVDRVHTAGDAEEALVLMSLGHVDAVVVVASASARADFETIQRLRASNDQLWIIVSAARLQTSPNDYITAGADLLVQTSANPAHWQAIHSLIQRRKAVEASDPTQEGSVNVRTLELTGPSNTIQLTESEARILSALTMAPSRSAEYWQLLESAKLDTATTTKGALEIRISRLRAKMSEAGFANGGLQVVRNFGYRLTYPLQLIR